MRADKDAPAPKPKSTMSFNPKAKLNPSQVNDKRFQGQVHNWFPQVAKSSDEILAAKKRNAFNAALSKRAVKR